MRGFGNKVKQICNNSIPRKGRFDLCKCNQATLIAGSLVPESSRSYSPVDVLLNLGVLGVNALQHAAPQLFLRFENAQCLNFLSAYIEKERETSLERETAFIILCSDFIKAIKRGKSIN